MAGELEATASILKTIFGEKQLAGIAPAFAPQGGGFLGKQMVDPQVQQTQQEPIVTSTTPTDLIGQEVGAVDKSSITPKNGTPKNGEKNQEDTGFIGNFFNTLDQNLQSPSKVLGLGMLSQIDPRLAQAGLFGMGLFGGNR